MAAWCRLVLHTCMASKPYLRLSQLPQEAEVVLLLPPSPLPLPAVAAAASGCPPLHGVEEQAFKSKWHTQAQDHRQAAL